MPKLLGTEEGSGVRLRHHQCIKNASNVVRVDPGRRIEVTRGRAT